MRPLRPLAFKMRTGKQSIYEGLAQFCLNSKIPPVVVWLNGKSTMRHQVKLPKHSTGERGIYLAYCVVGVFGAVLAFLVVNQLAGNEQILSKVGAYDLWAIVSGAVGATSGLYLGRRWLGGPGLAGWLNALVAIPVVSFMGSLVAGTIALPIYGTMFGPLALAVTLYENVIVLFLWIWTVLVTHSLFCEYRKERLTIFEDKKAKEDAARLPA